MKTVTMLKFRNDAEAILRQVGRGQSFVLTYRGKPVAKLEPLAEPEISAADPVYRLSELATSTGESMSNQEMDRLIYGT
jgi:prevent-host-death family protein